MFTNVIFSFVSILLSSYNALFYYRYCFKVYFVWYEYCYSSFFWFAFSWSIFSILSLSVCFFLYEVVSCRCYRDGSFLKNPISHPMSSDSLTFKMIITGHVLITILLQWLFLQLCLPWSFYMLTYTYDSHSSSNTF